MPMGRPFSQPAEDAPPTRNECTAMFRNPFKRNESLISLLLDFHGVSQPPIPPSETPLFDATVLATGVNPEPYEMDHVDQAFHSAHVTGPMVHTLSRLALPLYTTVGDAA